MATVILSTYLLPRFGTEDEQQRIYLNKILMNAHDMLTQGIAPTGAAGGDLTGTYPNPTIAGHTVINSKLAQMNANSLKGNNTGGLADAQDLSVASVNTMLGTIISGTAAGGSLAGTYPNPTIAASGVVGGTYGDGSNIPQLSVGNDGRLTSVSSNPVITPFYLPCLVVATTNQGVLSGSKTIDGVVTANGNLVLLTAQTISFNNGPWIASSGSWTRPTWFATNSTTQAFFGGTFFVTSGTVNGGTFWEITTATTINIGIDTITISKVPFQSGAYGTNSVANASLAQMAARTIKGNNTLATANAADLTPAQAATTIGVGGLGTTDSAVTSLVASTQNVIPGTKFQIATSSLNVGSVFRFTLGLTKTAVGTATWSAKLCFGTAGTNADTAIATWTSGTNSSAVDRATLQIVVRITALGASGTAAAIAFYTNTLPSGTGLDSLGATPGATAAINTTLTSPFFHVDITPGVSAVMNAWGMAEQLVA